MAKVRCSEYIAAPQHQVFEAFADLEKSADRMENILNVEILTDGPIGAGTRWRETRMMFGKPATEEMTIAEFEPPKQYVVEAENHGARYRTTFTFEPEGDGTRVTMTFRTKAVSLVAKLMSPLGFFMKGSLKNILAEDLAALKRVIEAKDETA